MPRHVQADRYSTTARDLAKAALKIAEANHYMVGFDADQTKDISLADYQDAHQYLIDLELQVTRARINTGSTRFDLAFAVLSQACKRVHKFELSR